MSKKIKRSLHGVINELQITFRGNEQKYEFLARLSLNRPSTQSTVDQRLFPPGWERTLATLRTKQRAMGIPDEEFLHPRKKRELGIPVRTGRRPQQRGGLNGSRT